MMAVAGWSWSGEVSDHGRVVCGRHATKAALAAGRLVSVMVTPGTNADLVAKLVHHGVRVTEARAGELARQAGTDKHQNVVGLCRELVAQGWPAAVGDAARPLVVVLDQVQDPRNLGACLRTAAALGAQALVHPRRRSATLTPAARKVAAGAEEHVAVVEVANIARELDRMRERGYLVVGADAAASTAVGARSYPAAVALVMGGEAGGLRQATQARCDELVRIPMPRRAVIGSLNVAVACGICLAAINANRAADT